MVREAFEELCADLVEWVCDRWLQIIAIGFLLFMVFSMAVLCSNEMNAEGIRTGEIVAIEKNGESWQCQIISSEKTDYVYYINDEAVAKSLWPRVKDHKKVIIKYKGRNITGIENIVVEVEK